jgi:choline dehydrogenase
MQADYVIVGAGSAGCAVAGRLAEAGATVGLVEAGPPSNHRLFEVPALFSRQLKSLYDWDFETDPEPHLNGRRVYLPRGRAVGGTSAMNTMAYVRGNPADYDDWERLGAIGWSYRDVLPFFRLSEDNERGADEYHGAGGPLSVSDPRSVDPLLTTWVRAAEQAGIPANPDFNGAIQDGAGIYQVTQRDGLRCSSARAFLRGPVQEANVTILHSTLALRIVLGHDRAVGLEVDRNGETRTIAIGEELVVSAGAYQSPHLLLLSGIGPADELAQAGVHPVLDHPDVGRHLEDHAGVMLGYPTRDDHRPPGDTTALERELRSTGRGPMVWNEAGAFTGSSAGVTPPDLQFHAALGLSIDEGLQPASEPGISFGPYVGRPESRGWVRLRTPEPYSKPRIQHNYLTEHADRERTRDGIRLALEIARQPALREHLADRHERIHGGLVPANDSDGAIDAYIERAAFSFYHPSCTCAIGRVVDPELRVLGLANVRVADTSVMPRLITGNTNAPAIGVGDPAAAFITGVNPPVEEPASAASRESAGVGEQQVPDA